MSASIDEPYIVGCVLNGRMICYAGRRDPERFASAEAAWRVARRLTRNSSYSDLPLVWIVYECLS